MGWSHNYFWYLLLSVFQINSVALSESLSVYQLLSPLGSESLHQSVISSVILSVNGTATINQSLRRALGPIKNRKTVEKNHPKPKNRKKIRSKPEIACKTVSTDTFSHPGYQSPDRSDTVVTSGAYRVNCTNFITVLVNAMELAFASSSICLNYRLYLTSSMVFANLVAGNRA